jgi:hypothetical protein
MTLRDAATREAMLATGMEQGMEAAYARLERVVAGDAGVGTADGDGAARAFFETLGFAAMGGGDDGAVPGRPGDPPACAADLRG